MTTADTTAPKPMGGTELILANLKAALPELTEKVQIIMSRPEQVVHEDKPRILWLQDLPQDPASARLRDKSYRTNFNRIVFASNWQQQMYNLFLGIPYGEGVVIKNGVPMLTPTLPKKVASGQKTKFLYTSTPHRGLNILAASAEALAKDRQDWELHVYSSFNIYGWTEQDKQMQPLYDRLKENPCVVYHGSQPNDVIRQACLDSHVFVYPSIYQETSCMAIQEAMMAGCLALTTNLAGLIETCGDWAWTLPYTEDANRLAHYTYDAMNRAIDNYNTDYIQSVLQAQSQYYQSFYSFESRIPRWKMLLETVVQESVPTERFVIE